MNARRELIDRFIAQAGWGYAERVPLPGDASTRRYVRLVRGATTAMLMDQPISTEAPKCPPGATPDQRKALGYNAMARLAGGDVRPFAALSRFLGDLGLSAPRIVAADYANGLLLHEDFGDDLIARLAEKGQAPKPFYEAAVDALVRLHRVAAPPLLALDQEASVPLLSYDATALGVETELLIEWFLPLVTGRPVAGDVRAEYRALWAAVLPLAVPERPIVMLRDYHAENIFWLPARSGAARAGLIDFQDALAGHAAYDLVSLVEDARRDVDPTLAAEMTARYVARARAEGVLCDEAAFHQAAAILATQRNVRIVGIFARLWQRDGKSRYLSFLPRMWGYLARDLAHPSLAALQHWFAIHVPEHLRSVPHVEKMV